MEARAAEDAAAKAALVRDFPSLQPTTPSPAAPHCECLYPRINSPTLLASAVIASKCGAAGRDWVCKPGIRGGNFGSLNGRADCRWVGECSRSSCKDTGCGACILGR